MSRKNQDKNFNDYGFKLLSLCNTVDLCILNWRSFNDKGIGAYTFYNHQGKSTIDFVLCNNHALKYICDFNVFPPNIFSDHCIVDFDMNINLNQTQRGGYNKGDKIFISKWKEDKKKEYISALNSEETILKLESLLGDLEGTSSCEVVEENLKKFTEILVKTGAGHIKEVGKKSSSNGINRGQEWYDSQCRSQKEIFRQYELRYYDTGLDEDRVAMCEQRSIYRNLCRKKKRELNQKDADRFVRLSRKDPKEFWREFKGFNDKNKGTSECNFYEHFSNLANVQSTVGEEGKKGSR